MILSAIAENKDLVIPKLLQINSERHPDGPQMLYAISDGLDPETGLAIEAATGAADENSGNKVAIIPVLGTMNKRGDMCSYGTKDIVAMINQANADPNVGSIVLEIDSPGGAVDGTEELAMAVKNSAKPVVAFIDGLGASAAYWVASQSSYIYANSEKTAFIGSIGTLAIHVDQSQWLEKEGVKVSVIRAEAAKDKAHGNPYEPLTDDVKAQFVAELNSINDFFISSVKSGRGDKLHNGNEDVFTGKVYDGKSAVSTGLIDRVGTMQNAVRMADQLAKKKKNSDYQNNANHKTQDTMNFKFLSAMFGRNVETISKEEMVKVEEGMADSAEQISILKNSLSEKTTENDKNAADLATEKAAKATLQKEFDDFKAAAATSHTKTKPVGDEGAVGIATETPWGEEAEKVRKKAASRKPAAA
jgi:signal peptide peptidase SppA